MLFTLLLAFAAYYSPAWGWNLTSNHLDFLTVDLGSQIVRLIEDTTTLPFDGKGAHIDAINFGRDCSIRSVVIPLWLLQTLQHPSTQRARSQSRSSTPERQETAC